MKIIHRYDVDQIKTTSTERLTLPLDKYAGVPFLETDTGNFYIHNGLAWTGPYTAADVGLGGGGGSSGVSGLARPRWIEVNNAQNPDLAANGKGLCDWGLVGVRGIVVNAAQLTVNLAAGANIPDIAVRWAIASDRDQAALLLPAKASFLPSATDELGEIGMFELEPRTSNNASATFGTFNLGLKRPEFIDVSAAVGKLYFRQDTGGILRLFVSAVQVIS